MSKKIVTESEVRLSYANLLEPRAQEEGQDPTFSVQIRIPKSDKKVVDAVNKAINEALKEGVSTKWGGKKPSGLRHPLRDGDKELDGDGNPRAEGHWFFNAKGPRGGKEAPFLYAKNGRLVTKDDPRADEIIYSGVFARVSLDFYPYDKNGNRGVAVQLVSVLSGEHGERLDSRPTATSALAAFGIDPLAADADENANESGEVWDAKADESGEDEGDLWGPGK